MKKSDVKTIVKTFYDNLEQGKILARKCIRCGHVEYPPFLICNGCGNLDTEWIELPHKAMCNQVLPPAAAFAEPEFRSRVGDYWVAAIQPEDCDESGSCLIGIDPSRIDEYRARVPFEVRPVIVQDADTKIVMWQPTDVEDQGLFFATKGDLPAAGKEAADAIGAGSFCETIPAGEDEIAEKIIACAASAYEVEESSVTLATDIREDLANQSMKMIAMLAGIEEELDVTIEIPEAGNLNTIGDFVNHVKTKLGIAITELPAAAINTSASEVSSAGKAGTEELDEIAEAVIACAAEAYEADESEITLATDIREDLANQSMKMIAMLAGIEEKLDVTIEIPEAGNLNTIGDFIAKVREKLG